MSKNSLFTIFQIFVLFITTNATKIDQDPFIINNSDEVSGVVELKNGDIASGDVDKNVIKVWNTNDGTLKKTLEDYSAALVLLKNGDLANTPGDVINIWNSFNGTIKLTLKGHTNIIKALAVLQNGFLASGSWDNTVKIWDTNKGTLIRTLMGHVFYVSSLAVLPNGDLASGSWDQTIKIWNVSDGIAKKTLNAQDGWVNGLVALPNGDLASVSFENGPITIWDVNEGKVKKTLGTGGSALAVLPNGDVVSTDKFDINIWDPSNGAIKKTLKGHTNLVTSLVPLKDGRLASGSWDKTIRIWNISN